MKARNHIIWVFNILSAILLVPTLVECYKSGSDSGLIIIAIVGYLWVCTNFILYGISRVLADRIDKHE